MSIPEYKNINVLDYVNNITRELEDRGYNTEVCLGTEFLLLQKTDSLSILATKDDEKIEISLESALILISKEKKFKIKRSPNCTMEYSELLDIVSTAVDESRKPKKSLLRHLSLKK
jgi:hypothetical protein